MKKPSSHRRAILALLLISLAIPSVASLAEADDGRSRRHRGHHHGARVVRHAYRPAHVYAPRYAYVGWHSHSVPAFAGFVGGLVLGATVAHATPVRYAYWDADCGQSFASIEIYNRHGRMVHHPGSVRAVAIPHGLRWDDLHGCGHCGIAYWGGEHACD